ncbi:hypothetical protein PIB30_017674 [Stylosanthes scabra]|uniref:Aminotransferase-like plant mobile domain-containing protein n=1 Tax=Stylosanthes scabra TaxID=79078 RepID=A0ABU6Y632_9FABA|nr:hypothetical protein [Stylosanthes scabra]
MARPLDLLQSWIFWRFPLLRPPTFNDIEWPLASRWYRYLPTSDKKVPRLQRLKRQLDLMPFSEVIRMSPVSDVGGRGGARPTDFAGGTQSPLVFHRPTYILWDHRAGIGRGEGGDAAPTQQTQGGASTSQAVEEAGTSS